MFNPEFLEKYQNQIKILLKENSYNFKKVILLKQLLNYSIKKYQKLLDEIINLN
ncbi:hypothetical protein [Buchnera aphidicola]|uniref:hypothetical protein n=1 Tax=Buchnera aphidicola TaxID=9 RepID=UPI0002D5B4F8|nr:hypothetical protein [Buchnera aphidicola]